MFFFSHYLPLRVMIRPPTPSHPRGRLRLSSWMYQTGRGGSLCRRKASTHEAAAGSEVNLPLPSPHLRSGLARPGFGRPSGFALWFVRRRTPSGDDPTLRGTHSALLLFSGALSRKPFSSFVRWQLPPYRRHATWSSRPTGSGSLSFVCHVPNFPRVPCRHTCLLCA